jgi:hypothetical protein
MRRSRPLRRSVAHRHFAHTTIAISRPQPSSLHSHNCPTVAISLTQPSPFHPHNHRRPQPSPFHSHTCPTVAISLTQPSLLDAHNRRHSLTQPSLLDAHICFLLRLGLTPARMDPGSTEPSVRIDLGSTEPPARIDSGSTERNHGAQSLCEKLLVVGNPEQRNVEQPYGMWACFCVVAGVGTPTIGLSHAILGGSIARN